METIQEKKKSTFDIRTTSPEQRAENKAKRVAKRDARKEDRVQKRDDKIEGMIDDQAARHGVDLGAKPTSAASDTYIKETEERFKKEIGDEAWDKIKSVAALSPPPRLEDTPELDKEQLKRSAARERKARWADALYAFGQGLRGGTADPRAMKTKQLQMERDEQFQNYKDISERNRKTQNLWEAQRTNQLINYHLQESQNEKNDAATKLKHKQELERLEKASEYRMKEIEERNKGAMTETEARIKAGAYDRSGGTSASSNPEAIKLKRAEFLEELRVQQGEEAAKEFEARTEGRERTISRLQDVLAKYEEIRNEKFSKIKKQKGPEWEELKKNIAETEAAIEKEAMAIEDEQKNFKFPKKAVLESGTGGDIFEQFTK